MKMIFSSFLSSLVERFSAYRNYRRTLKALYALNDRELHDIGVFRSSIDKIARGAMN